MELLASYHTKNRYAKALGVDIEDLSVNEVLTLIMETPRILKKSILVDEKTFASLAIKKMTFELSCRDLYEM